MADPLEQRVFQRRNVLLGVLLLVAFVIELASSGVDPAVWTLVIGLLVGAGWVGAFLAGRLVVDRYVADKARRPTEVVLVLGVVMAVVLAVSRVADSGRNDGQLFLAVVGLTVMAFLVARSVVILRNVPEAGSR